MRQGLVNAAIVAVAAVAVVITAWAAWPRPATVAVPRAHQYLDVSACLLTGSSGVAPGTPGARAWHAMRSASLARVSCRPRDLPFMSGCVREGCASCPDECPIQLPIAR